jgi:hypothetical protein
MTRYVITVTVKRLLDDKDVWSHTSEPISSELAATNIAREAVIVIRQVQK